MRAAEKSKEKRSGGKGGRVGMSQSALPLFTGIPLRGVPGLGDVVQSDGSSGGEDRPGAARHDQCSAWSGGCGDQQVMKLCNK